MPSYRSTVHKKLRNPARRVLTESIHRNVIAKRRKENCLEVVIEP